MINICQESVRYSIRQKGKVPRYDDALHIDVVELLNRRLQRPARCTVVEAFCLLLSMLSLGLIILTPFSGVIPAGVLILGVLATSAARQIDRRRQTLSLQFQIEAQALSPLVAIYQAWKALASAKRVWRIEPVIASRVESDGGNAPRTRRRVYVRKCTPARIATAADCWGLVDPRGKLALYCLPDGLYRLQAERTRTPSYAVARHSALHVQLDVREWYERGWLPGDAADADSQQVVRRHWLRRAGLVRYAHLTLSFGGVPTLCLQASSIAAAEAFASAFAQPNSTTGPDDVEHNPA